MLPYVFSATPVGRTIRRLRKERGLTQEELAEQLGVTAQAVSKWENETGMPDISQIVPLAGVFGVSTDVIFGLDTTTAGEDVTKILRDAEADKVRGGAASYIKAYDRISEGLRKYPCDQRLLMNGFTLGMSLCMPDSGFYSAERADEIAAQLGKAYIAVGRSSDAVKLFERYFAARDRVLIMISIRATVICCSRRLILHSGRKRRR